MIGYICIGAAIVLIPSGLMLLYMIRYKTAYETNGLVIDGHVSEEE
jgi:hypothetical protein